MFRISNTMIGVLNIVTLFVSLTAMGCSAYIHLHRTDGTDCQKVLQYPLLFGGLFIFVVSVLGIVGSLCRVNVALYAYLIVTFFVVVLFVFFSVFAFVVTDSSKSKVSSEHTVAEFSTLLQHYVINEGNWNDVKSCLVDARVCQNLAADVHGGGRNNVSAVLNHHLSATQFGCCRPPVKCGFKKKNATFWEVPKTGGVVVKDSDCRAWNNRQDKLCYDCNSCKGGVLANIRNQWKHLTMFNICVLLLLTVIYILGCYAIRNNRSNSKYHRHRAYP
ncbi:tetraspanin-11-like [Lotus japonicus]|uniref:tetraspanin-11-like n=1 Tax=Lotus japonicus TaxID=34305 RepID=UPI00258BC31D|nr:tetraspanin-11-like [Lotus japonicus]